MKRAALYLQAFAGLLFGAPAMAWDAGGHMLTGEIAWQRLRPEVRAKVGALVAKLPNEYHAGQPYNFVTAPVWMDDMRSMPAYPWSKLHYVNLEYTATGSPVVIPPPPHILSTIGECVAALKAPATTGEKRVEALGMLTHLVGDLHQPLHATDWGDRGGNGYLIMGVPFSDLLPKMVANLHTFWDKAYRFDTRGGKVVEAWRCPEIKDRPKAPGQGDHRRAGARTDAALSCGVARPARRARRPRRVGARKPPHRLPRRLPPAALPCGRRTGGADAGVHRESP